MISRFTKTMHWNHGVKPKLLFRNWRFMCRPLNHSGSLWPNSSKLYILFWNQLLWICMHAQEYILTLMIMKLSIRIRLDTDTIGSIKAENGWDSHLHTSIVQVNNTDLFNCWRVQYMDVILHKTTHPTSQSSCLEQLLVWVAGKSRDETLRQICMMFTPVTLLKNHICNTCDEWLCLTKCHKMVHFHVSARLAQIDEHNGVLEIKEP